MMGQGRKSSARMAALYGLLIALAFVFSYLEMAAGIVVPIPGVKLGLANLVNVVGLYTVGLAGTIAVALLRIVLVGFTFGNASTMMYALAGGALSLAAMAAARKAGFGKTGVSILGGVFHNIGQLTVAAFVTRTAGVFSYLPWLLAAGVVTGAVIGILGGMIVERIAPVIRRS
ncbi:MAG: Gx transporter family protein [Eubacteriales bacterium]|nr:Gx transporter family protein [Eubacteriales bacterium]